MINCETILFLPGVSVTCMAYNPLSFTLNSRLHTNYLARFVFQSTCIYYLSKSRLWIGSLSRALNLFYNVISWYSLHPDEMIKIKLNLRKIQTVQIKKISLLSVSVALLKFEITFHDSEDKRLSKRQHYNFENVSSSLYCVVVKKATQM